MLRPNVVWFGEMLPAEAFEAASAAIRSADLVLVVGTSGIVQPAASLPLLALERGTSLVEVNPVRLRAHPGHGLFAARNVRELLPQLVRPER